MGLGSHMLQCLSSYYTNISRLRLKNDLNGDLLNSFVRRIPSACSTGIVCVCQINKYIFIFLLVTFPLDWMFVKGRDSVGFFCNPSLCLVPVMPVCVAKEGHACCDPFL